MMHLCSYPLQTPFGFGFGGSGGNTDLTDPNIELDELNLPIPVPTPSTRIWKSKKNRPKDLTTTMVLPELCSSGSFCPDDGSGCRPQSGVGGSCELGRGKPNFLFLSMRSSYDVPHSELAK